MLLCCMATINILIMHLTVYSTMFTISTLALKTFKDKLMHIT